MTIFKAYDIRGIFPEQINMEIAYKIGRAFVRFLRDDGNDAKKIVIGQDMRISSKSLFMALTDGIRDEGANITSIGMCSTPMIYFATANYGFDASIMITASHNPKEYNGFKLSREHAIPISGSSGIKEIQKIVEQDNFPEPKEKGELDEKQVFDEYHEFIKSKFDMELIKSKPLKIVIDAANAMGIMETEHLKRLGMDIVPMFFEYDGTFPNHEANPIKIENMKALMEKVKEEKADFGIGYDGDADRVGFVDENGQLISADLMLALISEHLLGKEQYKGAHILYDLRATWAVKETIEKNNGTSAISRVGHSFIKEQMRKEDALFAGELAGHYYFKEHFFTDCTLMAILNVIEHLNKTDKRLSELIEPFRKYYHSGEINSKVDDADAIMQKILEEHKDAPEISQIDGIKIEYDDYWFCIRKSNTEPVIRLIVEAKTKEKMEEIKEALVAKIRS